MCEIDNLFNYRFREADGSFKDLEGFLEEVNVLIPGWISRSLLLIRFLDDMADDFQQQYDREKQSCLYKLILKKKKLNSLGKDDEWKNYNIEYDVNVMKVLQLQKKMDNLAREKQSVVGQVAFFLKSFRSEIEIHRSWATLQSKQESDLKSNSGVGSASKKRPHS
eukprot:GHVL01006600.1.p2 GENE.GHVL01006600.1~~GHVL01006600.1.p2  ORF type:complete len:165 (+),score=39.07 GHVL01006600.1:25-519(+)